MAGGKQGGKGKGTKVFGGLMTFDRFRLLNRGPAPITNVHVSYNNGLAVPLSPAVPAGSHVVDPTNRGNGIVDVTYTYTDSGGMMRVTMLPTLVAPGDVYKRVTVEVYSHLVLPRSEFDFGHGDSQGVGPDFFNTGNGL